MKKIICIALTLLLTFSSVFCGFSTVSAADKDTLIIHPALFNRDSYRSTEDSRWYYSENRLETMPDLAVKTGDIVEVSFYMKAKSSEVTGVNSLHIMSFYSGTHEAISNYTTKQVYYSNEGYLHFTDQYYTNGDIAQVKEYGSTITMPSPNAKPNDEYRHFGYTASSAMGTGNWSDWNRLYSISLVADKPGETCVESWVYDVACTFNNNQNMYVEDYTLFDYKMDLKVVGHTEPKQSTVIGDVDGNGSVSIDDATLIQMYAANLLELDDLAVSRADVGNDGSVNVDDATLVQLYVANLIDEFPRKSL